MASDRDPVPVSQELLTALNTLGNLSERMLQDDVERLRQRERRRADILQRTMEEQPNRLPPEERYQRDPAFHALVTMLRQAIANADYTPTELREAVTLACIQHEMNRPARADVFGNPR